MNKCAVKNVELKEQPTHFIILSYAGNAGRSLGDNLIQGLPIGNTEEKHETNTKTNNETNHASKKIPQGMGSRNNETRNGGKRMNKYQSSLLTWLVGISYATRKL